MPNKRILSADVDELIEAEVVAPVARPAFDASALLAFPGMPGAHSDGSATHGPTGRYEPPDIAALLADHRKLLSGLEPKQRAAAIVVGLDTSTALADLLDERAPELVERVAAPLGASWKQRAALAAMLVAGAVGVGLGASAAMSSDDAQPADPAAAPTGATTRATSRQSTAPGLTTVVVAERGTTITGIIQNGTLTGPSTVPSPMTFDPTIVGLPAPWVPTTGSGSPAGSGAATTPSTVFDTDPSLVDIGSPPVPEAFAPAPGLGSSNPGEVFEEPHLAVEPPLLPTPGEVFVEPTLIIDFPVAA